MAQALMKFDRRTFLRIAAGGVTISSGLGPQVHANENSPGPGPYSGGAAISIRNEEFFSTLKATKLMGAKLSSEQIGGMEGLIKAFFTHGDGNLKTLAYALATAAHETGFRMSPVREGFATSDAHARRILRDKRYAKSTGPYGYAYYGRGLPQLTWEANYRTSSKDAGVDLLANPDAMLDPVISARVLFVGLIDGRWNGSKQPHTGKGLGHYLPFTGADDLKNARRTVNGLDKWNVIAGYYQVFMACIARSI